MPPSGFNSKQSSSIRSFLRACLNDLIAENDKLRSPTAALQRELNHIEADMREHQRSGVETKILELTRAFYQELLSSPTNDFGELDNLGENCLERIEQGILSIHVSDIE